MLEGLIKNISLLAVPIKYNSHVPVYDEYLKILVSLPVLVKNKIP
jgi:hypothetical protein